MSISSGCEYQYTSGLQQLWRETGRLKFLKGVAARRHAIRSRGCQGRRFVTPPAVVNWPMKANGPDDAIDARHAAPEPLTEIRSQWSSTSRTSFNPMLRCMSPELARSGSHCMSASAPLSGE
jgi:hypothetical protein